MSLDMNINMSFSKYNADKELVSYENKLKCVIGKYTCETSKVVNI